MRGGLICLYGIWKQQELAAQLVGSSACRVGVLRYAATQISPDRTAWIRLDAHQLRQPAPRPQGASLAQEVKTLPGVFICSSISQVSRVAPGACSTTSNTCSLQQILFFTNFFKDLNLFEIELLYRLVESAIQKVETLKRVYRNIKKI